MECENPRASVTGAHSLKKIEHRHTMDLRRFLVAELEDRVRSLGEFSSFCLNTVLQK